MIEFVATIIINAAPDQVFRFVANRENYPRWISVVSGERVAILSQGPFGEGTLIREGHGVMRVVNVQVNRSFELELIRLDFLGRTLLKHGHTLFQFNPDENGTQVTWKAQIESAFFIRPFDRLLSRRAQQNVQAGLEQLEALLEHD